MGNDNISIVFATKEYYEAAAEIGVRAWVPIRKEFRKILGDDIYEPMFENWQDTKRTWIIKGLEAGHGYVALIDGKVVGFIYYFVDEKRKVGIIDGEAVEPEYSGRGIGTMLCNYALNKMREEGLLRATVGTGSDPGHEAARRTYEKCGFEKFLPSVEYYMNL